ncbi:MAG TPA: uroporphyrinogen decarboxylase [Candidatus Megaira endosymbiont of Nemacystus decipiens]|nr:uroporphyrinogen decarboxylase [Candidatus Megaera endosymbiont of Nemacystus decipiens]
MFKILEKNKIPIWLMRQAGRHLSEYRKVRTETDGFLDLCYNPSKACEVTMQPVERYNMDAAIIFSDILVLPDCLNWDVSFKKGTGPLLKQFKSEEDLKTLKKPTSLKILKVYEAIEKVKKRLHKNKALIGFAGAPWTVATYMIEGKGKQDFVSSKCFIYNKRNLFSELISLLTERTIDHLSNQILAGANMVQLFDSWAGVISSNDYDDFVITPTKKIVKKIKAKFPDVKFAGFPRGSGFNYERYIEKTNIDIIGVDQFVPLEKMKKWKEHLIVQGNLDPVLLLSENKNTIKEEVDKIINCLGGGNFILNLGHGVLPQTPVENVKFLVDYVKNL